MVYHLILPLIPDEQINDDIDSETDTEKETQAEFQVREKNHKIFLLVT